MSFRKPPRTVHGKQFAKTSAARRGRRYPEVGRMGGVEPPSHGSHRLLVDIWPCVVTIGLHASLLYINAPHCLTSGLGWVSIVLPSDTSMTGADRLLVSKFQKPLAKCCTFTSRVPLCIALGHGGSALGLIKDYSDFASANGLVDFLLAHEDCVAYLVAWKAIIYQRTDEVFGNSKVCCCVFYREPFFCHNIMQIMIPAATDAIVMAMAMPSDILSDTLAMNWIRGSLVVMITCF